MNHSVFRARDTETWRIVAFKKVGFDKFEPESVYMAKDFVIHFKNNLKKDCDTQETQFKDNICLFAEVTIPQLPHGMVQKLLVS